MSDAQPITGLRPGDVPRHVFLCGDPARVDRISEGWKGLRRVCEVREYRILAGECDGIPVAAASTGIGAPSTAILLEELVKTGSEVFLRIGNSGGLAPAVEAGDLVISTGSVRDDGTTRSYVAPEYPALADWRLVAALVGAAERRGTRYHAGITWSLDAFYARNAVLEPDGSIGPMSVGDFRPPGLSERIEAMRAARVLNCEMESGALHTLASLFGVRAGTICVVSDLAPWPGPSAIDLDRNMGECIAVATEAMLKVAQDV